MHSQGVGGDRAAGIADRKLDNSTNSGRQAELCRDFLAESAEVSGALGVLREAVADGLQQIKELQAVIAERLPDRGSWADLLREETVRNQLQSLDAAVAELARVAIPLEGSARGMDACIERVRELQLRLDRFDANQTDDEVRWYERRGRGFSLNITPLEVSAAFSEFRNSMDAAWLFTSATLAVNDDFSHFTRQMGLEDAEELLLDSPFDYANNAVMWLPEDLPEPRDHEFVPRLMDKVIPLLEASQGRAFLLFTSHRALRMAAEILADRVDFPLFIQGDRPRSILLEEFRDSGRGVLLGSASFWEGVDVIGQALSLVVIDKLPFAAPDDPVIEARSALLRRSGGNPFTQLYLPQAVISLKQGAGRLIRDVKDRGALVICDPRIRTKSYGQVFRESLPPMKQAGSQEEVEVFLDETAAGN